jgi:hypothetical protein
MAAFLFARNGQDEFVDVRFWPKADMPLAPCQQLFYEFSSESIGYRRISKAPANNIAPILAPPATVHRLNSSSAMPDVHCV